MAVDLALLTEFFEMYPFQPATAWWRAIEIDHLLRYRLPSGVGLDVGCGDGILTRIIDTHMEPATRTWIGVDPDPAETALATQSGLYAQVLTAPADRIEQPDARFDFSLSNSVLEHIADVAPVLREVARVLKPGAPFVLTVPSAQFHDCLRGPSWFRRALLRQERAQYLEQIDRRLAHRYYWDEQTWRSAANAAGFENLEFSQYFSANEVRRWEMLSNLTAGILYEIFGRRPPIEIQRTLGLRRGRTMPKWLARAAAAVVSIRARTRAETPYGGLMVVAHRRMRAD